MKKVLAALLCLSLLLSAGCASKAPQTTAPIETTAATEPTKPGAEIFTEELKAKLDEVLEQNKYEGIVFLTCDGEDVYQWVRGTNDLGEPLTVESPMIIASTSKQFCAAAILMLRDQGKLSLDDSLTKYFPEYTIAKDVTLHHLLSMQSGIPRDPIATEEEHQQALKQTPEENMVAIKEWTFEQPLQFTPGSQWAYSNLNYNLLSCVVELVSGQSYMDFLTQNILEPLGMTHTSFVDEIRDHPEWGLSWDRLVEIGEVPGLSQGCGDIVTTAGDMELWMAGLQSGKVVCKESFQEMATVYAKGYGYGYGYGLETPIRGGWGHGGNMGHFSSWDYFNGEYGLNLYLVDNNTSLYGTDISTKTMNALLRVVFEEMDAAS